MNRKPVHNRRAFSLRIFEVCYKSGRFIPYTGMRKILSFLVVAVVTIAMTTSWATSPPKKQNVDASVSQATDANLVECGDVTVVFASPEVQVVRSVEMTTSATQTIL